MTMPRVERAASIDLNSDLGESYGAWVLGDDEAMLDVVSSANVACGFHAGDPLTLLRTVRMAAERGVAVGAQVSYPDLVGFGRRFLDVEPDALTADVVYQLGALAGIARATGTRMRYLKPHGALYNASVVNEGQAAAVVRGVQLYDPDLAVLGLSGSALLRLAADAGLRTLSEAFADRGYTPDGTLLPRSQQGAVLHDPERIADRMVRLVTSGTLVAVDGTELAVAADSICVHGDSPGAVQIARAVRKGLTAAGVIVRSFAADGTR